MRITLTALLCALIFSSRGFSCSCISSGACPGLGSPAAPVFVGTVLSVSDALPFTDRDSLLNTREVRIRVDDSFGGLAPEVTEIEIRTGLGGGDCGIPFQAGDIYLVEAFTGSDGLLHTGLCSATRKIEGASTTLPILRAKRDRKPIPSLAGQISQFDLNFDGSLGMQPPKALSDLLIRIKSKGTVYETRSDSEGVFAYYDLPSGAYEFAPDLPPGTTLSPSPGLVEPPFPLGGDACRERNIRVFQSGSIQGRVTDSKGAMIRGAMVYILQADESVIPSRTKLFMSVSDNQGLYTFDHLPSGRYLLLVNPDDKQELQFPYPRTFSPGVPDRQSAAIVTVGNGEQVQYADILLQPAFAPRHLMARVSWADGRPVRESIFIQVKGTNNPEAPAHTTRPDPNAGVVDILLYPDEPYTIRTSYPCLFGDENSRQLKLYPSNTVSVNPHDNITGIALLLPVTACPEAPKRTIQ